MEGDTQPEGIQPDTVDVDVTTSIQVDPDRASIFYGSQEPQKEDAPEPSAEAQVEQNNAPAASEEVTEQAELPDVVAGKTEQPSAEAPADPPESTEEEAGEPISSWSQLVEHEGWDAEWANNLTLTQKIDGEEKDVTVGELLAVNQTLEAATKRLDDAKEKSKTILEEVSGQAESQAEHLAKAQTMVKVAEELLGLNNVEARLAQVREKEGDAAYLVEKDRVETLKGKIDQLTGYAADSMKGVLETLGSDGMTDEAKQELAIEENAKLMERIPEWKNDPELHQKEAGELVGYLSSAYQYGDDEIKDALDHRSWDMARKAMLWDRSQETSRATRKVVRTIPMKSGGQTPAQKGAEKRTRESVFYGNK